MVDNTDDNNKYIDLSTLDLPQLLQVKQVISSDVLKLRNQEHQISESLLKLNRDINAIKNLSKSKQNTDILIPLSNSVYIPGKLGNLDRVLVNIPNGFMIEKPIPKATNDLLRYFPFYFY